MEVLIVKGDLKGMTGFVNQSQMDETGSDMVYSLLDENGNKIWNGNLYWFPDSFLKIKHLS